MTSEHPAHFSRWLTKWRIPSGETFGNAADIINSLGEEDDWPHPWTRSLRGRVSELSPDTVNLIVNGYSK